MGPPDAHPSPSPRGSEDLHEDLHARVVLHTRPGCHLCDVARAVVVDVCSSSGIRWAEVDVDSEAAREGGLHERWTDLIPVVTVDGRHHAHFRVAPEALALALARGVPKAP